FSLLMRRLPLSTLFPYTTLFRSPGFSDSVDGFPLLLLEFDREGILLFAGRGNDQLGEFALIGLHLGDVRLDCRRDLSGYLRSLLFGLFVGRLILKLFLLLLEGLTGSGYVCLQVDFGVFFGLLVLLVGVIFFHFRYVLTDEVALKFGFSVLAGQFRPRQDEVLAQNSLAVGIIDVHADHIGPGFQRLPLYGRVEILDELVGFLLGLIGKGGFGFFGRFQFFLQPVVLLGDFICHLQNFIQILQRLDLV